MCVGSCCCYSANWGPSKRARVCSIDQWCSFISLGLIIACSDKLNLNHSREYTYLKSARAQWNKLLLRPTRDRNKKCSIQNDFSSLQRLETNGRGCVEPVVVICCRVYLSVSARSMCDHTHTLVERTPFDCTFARALFILSGSRALSSHANSRPFFTIWPCEQCLSLLVRLHLASSSIHLVLGHSLTKPMVHAALGSGPKAAAMNISITVALHQHRGCRQPGRRGDVLTTGYELIGDRPRPDTLVRKACQVPGS